VCWVSRGISFGGAFDAPAENWLRDEHFDVVREAGFDLVRLPVKWDSVAVDDVDRAIDAARRCGLEVVLNVHHFAGSGEELLALWARLAPRYAGVDGLSFELLHEPHDPLTAEGWNELLVQALAVVRATSPERQVIVGPARWNIVDALPTLRLPEDEHLIVTVHYYSPFRFTHQGADWLEGAHNWLGTRWGTAEERARVGRDLKAAATWAHPRPLFLGEFGTLETAVMADRAAWTALVRTEAERLALSWAYWDFATDFGAFDLHAHAWRPPLTEALLGAT
jgi:endoglucanase